MDIASRSAPNTDSKLVEILDRYLAAAQAGTPPTRAEIVAQYPELADDLEACLASLEFIHQGAIKERAVDHAAASRPMSGVLGD